jgi:hypothetical protein
LLAHIDEFIHSMSLNDVLALTLTNSSIFKILCPYVSPKLSFRQHVTTKTFSTRISVDFYYTIRYLVTSCFAGILEKDYHSLLTILPPKYMVWIACAPLSISNQSIKSNSPMLSMNLSHTFPTDSLISISEANSTVPSLTFPPHSPIFHLEIVSTNHSPTSLPLWSNSLLANFLNSRLLDFLLT